MERTLWLTRQANTRDLPDEEASPIRDSRPRKQVRCIHETVDLLSPSATHCHPVLWIDHSQRLSQIIPFLILPELLAHDTRRNGPRLLPIQVGRREDCFS